MILDQLIEKKDLYIYIDVRSKHLMLRVDMANYILSNGGDWGISKNVYKHMEKCKRRWLAQIKELKVLKSILSQGKLKSQAKVYWDQQNQKL